MLGADMLAGVAIDEAHELVTEAAAEVGAAAATTERAIEGGTPLFSPLELLVIGIGERDRPVSVRPDSRLARLGRFLFGMKTSLPFADRRLEALRSLSNTLRHRRKPDAALAAARANGLTPRQIGALITRNQH